MCPAVFSHNPSPEAVVFLSLCIFQGLIQTLPALEASLSLSWQSPFPASLGVREQMFHE